MDIDALTTSKRSDLMKKGACFGCREPGHMAKDCPKKKKNYQKKNYDEPKKDQKKKWNPKDAHRFIRSMSTQERKEFMDLMIEDPINTKDSTKNDKEDIEYDSDF